jgi:hypothetical protein
MRLDDYIDDLERDETAEKRRLVEQKSYELLDYLDEVERRFERATSGDAVVGSTAASVFVGRSGYPEVSAGVLSPVGAEDHAERHRTGPHWYERGFSIDDVLQHRTGLLNSARRTSVEAADRWNGFVGVQREVAIADRPVGVEIGLAEPPALDLSVDDVTTPTGPRATARDASLTENPHVPRPVKKTLEDDDWNAEGAMTYLYRRGLDVYDIDDALSAGALGQADNRRLVPTRWSITAVDDTVSRYLRGRIKNARELDRTEVWYNEYLGNRFWVILATGQWEFELVEMKAPGSIWNPGSDDYWVATDHEGFGGRTGYVDETAGAYYAARLGVLEHLERRERQATALVLREVTDEYWAPSGVWVVRETVRNAFEGECGTAESLHDALRTLAPRLPIDATRLRRSSRLAAGLQSTLDRF